jgi:hypothetical protein
LTNEKTAGVVELPDGSSVPDSPAVHTHCPVEPTEGQSQPREYLIGSLRDTQDFLNCCPYAATISAHSETLGEWVVIQIRCKRWTCRHCGERLIAHYARKTTAAEPNKFITLTVNNSIWSDPRAAYDGTRKQVTALATKLRRAYGEFEYLRVLEATRKGWPHYHLVARSPYIPQKELSELWKALTGAFIVDIKQVKKVKDVYSYIIKYLGKQTAVPWTKRRLAWSRHFWRDDGFKPGGKLYLRGEQFSSLNPASYLTWTHTGQLITAYSRDCWIVRPPVSRTPGEEG